MLVPLMKVDFSPVRLASLPVLVLCACSSFAQIAVRLPDTVVTATRIAQPLTEVVADISTLDRDDIERLGASSVTQLLRNLPGLQTTGTGDASRVYIRGADARMTALYVDGVRVDSQDGLTLGGGAPWELIPVSQIDRIEVVRGPVSAVYGSDAMGGVVQIFTRRGQGAAAPYINLGLVSLNTQQASAGVSGGLSGWSYAVGWAHENSDGYNTRPDLTHAPDHEPESQRSASMRLGYALSATNQVEVSALDSQRDSHYVPWGGGSDYAAHAHLSSAALKWQAQWSGDYRTQFSVSNATVAKRDDAPNDYQTTAQSVLLENHLKVAGATLSATLEQKRDAFSALATNWDPSIKGDRTQNAVALGFGSNWGAHAIQLNVRSDRDSIFGPHQTGAAAYAYRVTPAWRATLSSGTAFRAPTLEQIFGPYGSVRLQPETNQSTEMGLSYDAAATAFKAVTYRNAISSMISSSATLDTCSAGYFCYYNVGKASIRGVTFSGRQQFQHLELHAALDLLDPYDDITGRVLTLRARRTWSLGVETQAGGWQWGASVQGVGERFDNAANTELLPAYEVLHLHASTPLGKDWRLALRVDNATDRFYQEVGSYATPGRLVFLALQWQPAH